MKNKIPRRLKLLFQSSYDRGLDVLLTMWPQIKKKHPEATLDIAYGWELFDKGYSNNAERMSWKKQVNDLMQQDGVTHHGRIGKAELSQLRKQCGVLAYPTYFTEIFMIGAVEAQKDGLVPVTTRLGALEETAKTGFLIDGDIKTKETKDIFVETLIKLMGDEKLWEKKSKECKKFAQSHKWDDVANKWIDVFNKPSPQPKLTVYTPTIREGFWNIMASNLSEQEYKNFEWLIVDDYPKDRKSIAEKYAKKYNLEINYVRGKDQSPKRRYALVNANNTMMQKATGEFVVFLQDFILLKSDSLTQCANFYKHHPRDLYAPIDAYFEFGVEPDKSKKEDWFGGRLDVIGKFKHNTIRYGNRGFREVEDEFDFEANWGGMPLSVIKDLNGWWEFYDDGMGFDNSEIAFRAKKLGSRIFVDEWNVAVCLDHRPLISGDESGSRDNRDINLNDPRHVLLLKLMEQEKVGIVRDEKTDQSIQVDYEVPKLLQKESTDDIANWVKKNAIRIADQWMLEL